MKNESTRFTEDQVARAANRLSADIPVESHRNDHPNPRGHEIVYFVVGLLTYCRPSSHSLLAPISCHTGFPSNGVLNERVSVWMRLIYASEGSSQRLDHPGISPEFPVHSRV
ncbi:hypothetical protein Rcae01_03129 [Novipirellula caenicola]|uniref:Transposase n=1 Tax=Novipirellula caenicola TaxID=1536901 RepID=A0ABP9VR96_9BACT